MRPYPLQNLAGGCPSTVTYDVKTTGDGAVHVTWDATLTDNDPATNLSGNGTLSYYYQFELPVLFYLLIAIALPLRRTDLVIVLLSWVFVVTRFVHAGIFVTSNDLNQRSLAWFAGALVLFAMWVYFALKILLLI